MVDLGNSSPYEVVTVLKPKMPAPMVSEHDQEFFSMTDYIDLLQRFMRDTYRAVQRLQAAAHERAEGTLGGHLSLMSCMSGTPCSSSGPRAVAAMRGRFRSILARTPAWTGPV